MSEIKSFETISIDDQMVRCRLKLDIDNPNRKSIKIISHSLQASVNGKELNNLKIPMPIILEKKSNKQYNFEIEVESKKILSVLPSLILLGKVDLKLEGNVKVRYGILTRKVPILINKTITKDDLKF
jgi:LEA14-like dessication related protein